MPTNDALLSEVEVPDVLPSGASLDGEFNMLAGDFVDIFAAPDEHSKAYSYRAMYISRLTGYGQVNGMPSFRASSSIPPRTSSRTFRRYTGCSSLVASSFLLMRRPGTSVFNLLI